MTLKVKREKGEGIRFYSFLLTSAFILFPAVAHAFNNHTPFDITADVIEYVDANQEMTAEGHVVVVQTSSTLASDYMRYDRRHSHLYARGHVVMHEQGHIIVGDELDYDLVAEKGALVQGKQYGAPWRFQAVSWERNEDYFIGRQAAFTSCDLIDPHYHIRSSRVHLIPDRFFWAWNNVAYVDNLPVFYSPFTYKYLDARRVDFQVQPGQDDVNGAFAKTVTTLRLTPLVYDKVLWDHYTNTGNGFGNEFDYQGRKIRGSLFGYYINPHTNSQLTAAPSEPQYNLRSYHIQTINNLYSLQSNINLRKNVSFNNQYFQQDPNQGVNQILSSMALTRGTGQAVQHLSVTANQAPDANDPAQFPETHMQSATLPSYDFTLFQRPLWHSKAPAISSSTLALGATQYVPAVTTGTYLTGETTHYTMSITSASVAGGSTNYYFTPRAEEKQKLQIPQFSMNGNVGETYLRADEKIRTTAATGLTLSESFPITRKLSFTPSLVPSLSWQDKRNPPPLPTVGSTTTIIPIGLFRGFQGRWGTTDNLHYRPFSALQLDQTYSFTARMSPNDVQLDRGLADGGIETNHLAWSSFVRPSRTTLFRSSFGYDLRRIADEDPNAYLARRYDPWEADFTITPRHSNFDYYFQHLLSFYPMRTSLWEVTVNYTGLYRTRYSTSLLYNRGAPGTLTWNTRVGYFLSPGWRVDATANAFVPNSSLYNTRYSNMINTELILVRDLHCWEMQFIYRNLPPFSHQYSVLFNMKFGPNASKPIQDKDLESEFYPWRGNQPYFYSRS